MASSSVVQPPQREPRSLAAIILRNTLVMTLASWVLKAANFFYLIGVIRLLGEAGYGMYATVLAFVGMFGVFFELGMTQYVERSLAQGKQSINAVLGNLIALRLLLALAALIVLPVGGWFFGYDAQLVIGILIATGGFVLSAFLVPLQTILSAAERFDAIAALHVRTQLLSILLGLAVLLIGGGFLGLLAVGYLVLPIHILLTLRTLRRLEFAPLTLQIRLREWPVLLKAGIPFGLASLALTFNFHADTVILSMLRSSSDVGWYSAAYGLIFKLVAIADGLLLTMTPSLAREQTSNPERVRAWTSATVVWLALFGLPAAVGLWLLAEPITQLLFGTAFLPSAPVLAILAWDIPLLLFTAFCGSVAVAVGKEWPTAQIYLLCTILNVGLNLWLIPQYGIIAAALITICTDTVSALLFLYLLRAQIQLRRIGARLVRIGIASALMGLVVWWGRELPVVVIIGIGGMIFGVLALALGLIERQLIGALIGRIRAKIRPAVAPKEEE